MEDATRGVLHGRGDRHQQRSNTGGNRGRGGRGGGRGRGRKNSSSGGGWPASDGTSYEQEVAAAEASLRYLGTLVAALTKQRRGREDQWHKPPKRLPPAFVVDDGAVADPPGGTGDVRRQDAPQHAMGSNANPYEAIFVEDDDEGNDSGSSASEEEESKQGGVEDDDAGDMPLLNVLSIRRLLIRLHACQSDLLQHLGNLAVGRSGSNRHQQPPRWVEGADWCALAVEAVQTALALADEEICRWLSQQESQQQRGQRSHPTGAAPCTNSQYEDLVQDADIVSVSVQHLVRQRERFCDAAERERDRLTRRLEPQWESRDEVRERMGDRWYSNPHPKCDYAAARRDDEERLQQVELALEKLDLLDVNALENALKWSMAQLSRTTSAGDDNTKHRHNAMRPADLSRRVPWGDYPDPAGFGWEFTGSHEPSRVEFFQKGGDGNSADLVKLDWYYTTGTMKTSLDHPRRGRTQLFASGAHISPSLYRKVLVNPRAHTNVRYQKKDRNPSSSSRAQQQQQTHNGRRN